jgi:hypothetical protein
MPTLELPSIVERTISKITAAPATCPFTPMPPKLPWIVVSSIWPMLPLSRSTPSISSKATC